MSQKLSRQDFNLLESCLLQYGWTLRRCQENHWQILKAFVKPINLHWKLTGHLVIYVSGANKGKGIHPSVERIVEFINREEQVCSQINRRRQLPSQKRALWETTPHVCQWCKVVLIYNLATVDHLIPRSKGGSDRMDNLCLACHTCNQNRKDGMFIPGDIKD